MAARRIKKDDILDAVERVVVRLGASGLSIDAVAQEAAVSKSSVVYDYRTKNALLEALIVRNIGIDRNQVAIAVSECADAPRPPLFGRIAVAKRIPGYKEKAVALAIGASCAPEVKLQGILRSWADGDIKAMSTAENQRPR